MASEIAKPMTPMEEFQDNLKKSLRDDIARLLPEAALADMIKRVVEEEFFAKRRVEDKQKSNYVQTVYIDLPTPFQDMVMKAATPILEREAVKLVAKLEYKIADQIKDTVEASASDALMRVFTKLIDSAFVESEQRFRQGLVELLKRNGLQINAY